jgi:hypothetical protein
VPNKHNVGTNRFRGCGLARSEHGQFSPWRRGGDLAKLTISAVRSECSLSNRGRSAAVSRLHDKIESARTTRTGFSRIAPDALETASTPKNLRVRWPI